MAAPPAWNDLPGEIIQVLGQCLDARSWAACRAACSSWRANITSAIRVLEVDMECNAHRWMMVLTCVARIFPSLTSVVLLVSGRVSPSIFSERLASLAVTAIKLQELELRFIYLPNPMLGGWLQDLSGITELRGLKGLRLAGGACPPPGFFASLSSLRGLSVLEFLPGAYGQMAGLFDAHNDPAGFSDAGLGDAHLAAIGSLTQLRHLTVKVCPSEVSPDGLADLAAHGLLPLLQQLSLYDSELPTHCLTAVLTPAATALTHLQVGLSNVDDLSALGRLPKVQDLSLDTVALPDLRELVLAAARANIPASGPGCITGLCLLDQQVTSALELAALSQLSSLQELVLVNPTMEVAAGNEQQHPPAAAAAEDQQQQQGAMLDMAVLSGLSNLKLLQIDLLPRDQPQQQPPQQPQPQQDVEEPAAPANPADDGNADADDDMGPPPGAPVAAAAAAAGAQPGPHALALVPLRLGLTADSVVQLCASWKELVTLDLSGFGPDLLPASAVIGFSNLQSLKYLSLTSSDSLAVQQGSMAVAFAHQQQQQQLRVFPWWHLPHRLSSLCLTHFDLSGGSSDGASSSSTATAADPRRCCSSSCCLSLAQQGSAGRGFASGLQGRVQQLLSPRGSPLHHKRRRQSQTQQQQQQQQEASDASPDHQEPGETSAAACSCAARLAGHFSCLQALWLEQCVLPPHMLPACLPHAAPTLESLALLQVAGTVAGDFSVVGSLTALTSLRLLPADHSLEGLGQLAGLHHLKKLSVRMTHLLPSDLAVLSSLRSLFCLSLSAPLIGGQLLPGFPSAVRLGAVVEAVQRLPYCDLELVGEPHLGAPAAG